MLTNLIVQVVAFSRRFAILIVLTGLVAGIGLGQYAASNIKINTDIDQLMATGLDWRLREKELDRSFPQKQDRLVIVIDGTLPDRVEEKASFLAEKLRERKDLFKTVERPEMIPFFQKNGFLLMSEQELSDTLEMLISSQPLLGSLAKDPSLRGLFSTMGLALQGIEHGKTSYDHIAPSFALMAQTIQSNLAGNNVRLPWQSMMAGHTPTLRDLRKYIITQPILDFSDLSPGRKASDYIRELVKKNNLGTKGDVTVRLTGPVALNDQEFASVAEGASQATIVAFVLVIALLFLALRSYRLIIPILLTLIVGLIFTTSFALAVVGSLNLISVAFAVMFVGIAVDFGIQFGIRFRDERHKDPDRVKALSSTARLIAGPISFAAACSTIGFLAFIPTDYRGVSELGLIAGAGMVIAYILNLTLLPALLTLFNPPAEPEAIGYSWAAPVDRMITNKRKQLGLGILAFVILAFIVGTQVHFDPDPLNLKDPSTESVSTLFDIMQDPQASPYTIEMLAPDLDTAQNLAARLESLPEVATAMTLASFVPENQENKIVVIEDANFILGPTLNPTAISTPPTEQENYDALISMTEKLRSLGDNKTEARQLAQALEEVVNRNQFSSLDQIQHAFIDGMEDYLSRIRTLLSAKQVGLDSITQDLRQDWITTDGRARIELYPKGNARDHNVLVAFTEAVRAIAPEASGTAISIQESGRTVSNAFMQAAGFALLAISLLGWVILRRLMDVARLILPLIVAGILTLATMVTINLSLNFANIIALPLLLSLGVTYTIYMISYWKNGQVNPLQSSMARAVLFSAGTTLVAFGSLSLSSHPGTRSMGELLTIALVYSVLSTFLVLPVLLDHHDSAKT